MLVVPAIAVLNAAVLVVAVRGALDPWPDDVGLCAAAARYARACCSRPSCEDG